MITKQPSQLAADNPKGPYTLNKDNPQYQSKATLKLLYQCVVTKQHNGTKHGFDSSMRCMWNKTKKIIHAEE